MEWSRRGFLALACACALGGIVASAGATRPATASGALAAPAAEALARARASYAALILSFRGGESFAETSAGDGGGGRGTFAWPVSQAVAASVALAEVPGAGVGYGGDVARGLAVLDRYWQPGALGGYGSTPLATAPEFYDDNEWIAFDLLGAYALSGDRTLLARSRAVFELVASGWGADTGRCTGGVYWMRSGANRDRNAVTTENGALLALRLYALTGGRQYLRWALRMTAWSERCLARSDGLLADHLAADGTTDERAWSYNQGASIAAFVLLARATGDSRYLALAERRAAAALGRFGSFAGEPRIFVAIFFRDLAVLDAVRPRREYREALVRYADASWRRGRDPKTGLFSGDGPPTLLDQAAMVQIFSLLASPARRTTAPAVPVAAFSGRS